MKKLFRGIISLALVLCLLIPSALPAAARGGAELFTVTVSGGTAVFVYKNETFSGTAARGDVLHIALTPQANRTFKCWKSADGDVIPEEEFDILVGEDKAFYPVFEDSGQSSPGPWTLVSHGDCVQGDLYVRTNSNRDTEYKLIHDYKGYHQYSGYEKVDGVYHRAFCENCGKEKTELHNWVEDSVIKAPTHTEKGIAKMVCSECGAEKEAPIPVTEAHEWGPWTILKPAGPGEYGKRTRKCLYCDETETCWYIDIDIKALFRDHYIAYTADVGWSGNNEEYYSFENEDGDTVYIWAVQHKTSNAYDGRQTFVFMFIDDGDPDTLKPVYLTKSQADSGSGYLTASFMWAHYGYIRTFDEWLTVLDFPDDTFGCNDLMMGNGMSARGSCLISSVYDWVKAYNEMRIPVTEDPESFITTTGEFKKYEIESDDLARCQTDGQGGFPNCRSYRIWVSGEGDEKVYDHYVIDKDTNITLQTYINTTYPHASFYFGKYKEIKPDAEYQALDEALKPAYLNEAEVESTLKSFINQYNYMGSFTLEVPDPVTAVRIQYGYDENVELTVQNMGSGANVASLYRASNTDWQYPVTFRWAGDIDLVFEGWQKWNFQAQQWEDYSDQEEISFNSMEEPLTEALYIRVKYHRNPAVFRIRTEGGVFYLTEDYNYTPYVDESLPIGTSIQLEASAPENMELDHWENSAGETLDSYYDLKVVQDETYIAVFRDREYYLYVHTMDEKGIVTVAGETEPAAYADVSGKAGDFFTLTTQPEEGSAYTIFLGWYKSWWEEDGQVLEKIGDLTTLDYTIKDGNNDIMAVWSDGTVDLEPPAVKVSTDAGFIVKSEICDADWLESLYFTGYSVVCIREYNTFSLVNDPYSGVFYTAWDVSYTDAEDNPREDRAEGDFEYGFVAHYFVGEAANYKDGLLICSGVLGEAFVHGDIDGDGEISTFDYLTIKAAFSGEARLYGPSLEAADMNDDDRITTVDYLMVKRLFNGE